MYTMIYLYCCLTRMFNLTDCYRVLGCLQLFFIASLSSLLVDGMNVMIMGCVCASEGGHLAV